MKWPTTNKTSDKSGRSAWLKGLSDDQLDNLMTQSGLMEQEALDRQRDTRLVTAMAKLPGGPPDYCETWRGLMKLRDEGQLPPEAKDMYEKLRTRAEAEVKAACKAATKAIPSPVDVPADTSIIGWLKSRWSSADETVRNALQAVASTVGISIPMSRTRTQPIPPKDSSSTRRTESALQLTHDEQAPTERPAEKEEPEEPRYDDPPQWDDELADGWTPCESLHDALNPEDNGWY